MKRKAQAREVMVARRREDVRERLRNAGLLFEIEKSDKLLEEIAQGPQFSEEEAQEPEALKAKVMVWKETALIRVSAIKAMNDSRFKRLAKIVPDLKQVDANLSGDINVHNLHELSDAALKRLAAGES